MSGKDMDDNACPSKYVQATSCSSSPPSALAPAPILSTGCVLLGVSHASQACRGQHRAARDAPRRRPRPLEAESGDDFGSASSWFSGNPICFEFRHGSMGRIGAPRASPDS